MGVKDSELLQFRGFPGGIDNVSPETSVPSTHLREAVNVDLDNAGKVRRRLGYTLALTGAWHSLFADGTRLLGVHDGALLSISPTLATSVIRNDVGDAEISYTVAAGEVFWSNGRDIRRIDYDGLDAPVWPDCASQPSATAHATGGLAAGAYQVAITAVDAFGRESGSSVATTVDVAEGQGIALTGIPSTPGVVAHRVYVTQSNGDVLYHAVDVANGVSAFVVSSGARKKPLATQFLFPLPAGQVVRHWNGRLFVASGRELWWSMPLRYGLTHTNNYIRFATITMFEPMGEGPQAGAFIADTKRTYWMAGGDPHKWTMQIAASESVVPGSSVLVPGAIFGLEYSGSVPYWLDTAGVFCLGLPEGQVRRLTQETCVTPECAVRAATVLCESNGIRRLITGVQGGSTNTVAATDSAVATVRRRSVST